MKCIIKTVAAVALLTLIFGYGIGVGAYKWFPHEQIQAVKNLIEPTAQSVGRNREYRVGLFEEFYPPSELVFVGDSITEQGEWSDFFPSLRVANRGVGSDKTSDVLKRMDSILSVEADKALIMLGINDIYAEVSIEEITANYSAIVESLLENEVFVIIQSTTQCQRVVCGLEYVNEVNILNRRLESLAKKHNVLFLRLKELSNENGLDAAFTYDGVHLNSVGYRSWVTDIGSVMKTQDSPL